MSTAQESCYAQCKYIMSGEWLNDLKYKIKQFRRKVIESDPIH